MADTSRKRNNPVMELPISGITLNKISNFIIQLIEKKKLRLDEGDGLVLAAEISCLLLLYYNSKNTLNESLMLKTGLSLGITVGIQIVRSDENYYTTLLFNGKNPKEMSMINYAILYSIISALVSIFASIFSRYIRQGLTKVLKAPDYSKFEHVKASARTIYYFISSFIAGMVISMVGVLFYIHKVYGIPWKTLLKHLHEIIVNTKSVKNFALILGYMFITKTYNVRALKKIKFRKLNLDYVFERKVKLAEKHSLNEEKMRYMHIAKEIEKKLKRTKKYINKLRKHLKTNKNVHVVAHLTNAKQDEVFMDSRENVIHMYFNANTMYFLLFDDDEFASIVCHEAAHILLRHSNFYWIIMFAWLITELIPTQGSRSSSFHELLVAGLFGLILFNINRYCEMSADKAVADIGLGIPLANVLKFLSIDTPFDEITPHGKPSLRIESLIKYGEKLKKRRNKK